MPITYTYEDNNIGGKCFPIFADGIRLKSFTDLTGEENVMQFCALAEPHCSELARLQRLVTERIQWNINNPDAPLKQKMHPCFNQLERLWNRIQREAKIPNT